MGKIGALGVLRLRAPGAVSSDKSVRRSAQDDGFVVTWRFRVTVLWYVEIQKNSAFSDLYCLPTSHCGDFHHGTGVE
jgi:hypothetical protein